MSGRRIAAFVLAGVCWAGCIDVNIPGAGTLFATGEAFIVSGTAGVINRDGPCQVWVGTNGVEYYLFQGTRLASADFDRITTPGVTSRLELSTRSDLVTDCRGTTVVEVSRVLEIVE